MKKDEGVKASKPAEVMYVDRDRAAAVNLGNKDLTSLKKRKKEGQEEEVYDEKTLATYMTQGQHELK